MKLWMKVVVSLGLLLLLLVLLPWNEVREAATRLPLSVWLGVFAGFVMGHAVGVIKWRILVNAGGSSLHILDAVRCYSAGLFANLCLPSIVGGDVLRAALAAKATGRSEAAILGGVADRVIDVATLGILIAGGGLFARDALPGWGAQVLNITLLAAALALGIFLPLVLRRPLARWPRRFRRRIGRGLVSLRRLSRRPGSAVVSLLLSVLIQTNFVLLNAWLGRAIGIDVPLPVWFLVWPLAKAAGLLPISLGGLAVRDATLAALLVPVGVPAAWGVVASLIWQSVLIAGGLMAGIVWWILGRRSRATSAFAEARDLSAAASPGRYA